MKRIIPLCCVLLLTFTCAAQVKDAGLWMSGTAEYNFSMELSAEISEEFRFNENISELGSYFTDMGISYKLAKGLIRPSFHYRFVQKRKVDDSYSQRHRWYADLALRKKVGPFDIGVRTRYQSQYADMFTSDDGLVPDLIWRNKLSVKFDTEKKMVPFLSVELFTDIRERINNNVRCTFGATYKLNNVHQFNAFFLHQREFNVTDPYFDYVWGIGYTVAIDFLFDQKPQ